MYLGISSKDQLNQQHIADGSGNDAQQRVALPYIQNAGQHTGQRFWNTVRA